MAINPVSTRTFKNFRILLAEDDQALCSALKEALEREGYELVGVAANGQEAVELALTHTPDLILMDIKMPVMNGLEAARRINEKHFTPIVLITAFADPEFLRQAKEARVVGYLLKPVSIDELVSAIEIAQAIGHEINALEGQIEDLKAKLEGRKYIERAKGFLMDAYGMKEGEAMQFLRREARKRRIKIEALARLIVDAAKELLQKTSDHSQ